MPYRVKEFARIAGVTVRTLHFYDQAGLFKPAALTETGHRLYEEADLLRLQQILTLKTMGFSLREIREVLENPRYAVRRSLEIQKQAIDRKIAHLQQISSAMAQVLASDTPPDLHQIQQMIEGITMSEKNEWVKHYYSDEQMAYLQERAALYTPEQMQQVQQEWEAVYAGLKANRDKAPDHPDVQHYAAKWVELVGMFTGGNTSVGQSLSRMYADMEKMTPAERQQLPEPMQSFDMDLFQFGCAAAEIYQKNQQAK